jgi:hypothetical protein
MHSPCIISRNKRTVSPGFCQGRCVLVDTPLSKTRHTFLICSLLEKDAVFLSFSLAVSDLKGPVAFRDFGAVSLEVSLHCRHIADRKKQFILQSLLGGVLW